MLSQTLILVLYVLSFDIFFVIFSIIYCNKIVIFCFLFCVIVLVLYYCHLGPPQKRDGTSQCVNKIIPQKRELLNS